LHFKITKGIDKKLYGVSKKFLANKIQKFLYSISSGLAGLEVHVHPGTLQGDAASRALHKT